MANVFVAGVAVVDFVFKVDSMPQEAKKHRAQDAKIVGGGCAANAAVAIARLGGEASLSARLGDDAIGDMILADLNAEQVNTDYIHRASDGQSSFSSIYVDDSGERQIMNFRGKGLVQDTDWFEYEIKADVILADNRWPEMTKTMMAIAKAKNIPGVIDAEEPIELDNLIDASHVAFSRQGLEALTGESDITTALELIAQNLSAWVCVTDGASGVYYINKNKVEHIPAFEVEVVDTLGAGDIWHGAFALYLAEGNNEIQAIQFANAAAALKCTRYGGRAGCPDRILTQQFLMEKS